MRSLGASSTGSREGIGIAVCTMFLERHYDMNEVERTAATVGTGGFLSFMDIDMGRVIVDNSNICTQFTDYLANNPDVNCMWLMSNSHPDPKRGFAVYIMDVLGGHLKTTRWWMDNLKLIERERRKIKILQKVHDA